MPTPHAIAPAKSLHPRPRLRNEVRADFWRNGAEWKINLQPMSSSIANNFLAVYLCRKVQGSERRFVKSCREHRYATCRLCSSEL